MKSMGGKQTCTVAAESAKDQGTQLELEVFTRNLKFDV